MASVKIKYLGKVDILTNNTVVKTYRQTVSGSVWKKIGTDLLFMYRENYSNILIRINDAHPNKPQLLEVIDIVNQFFPVKVQII